MTKLEDTRWAVGQLTKTLVHYSVHDLGHMSFFIAKDASFFSMDVMSLLTRYMPVHNRVSSVEE